MGCPRCNGLHRVLLADGNRQCTTQIVLGLSPPMLIPGGISAPGHPVVGPCAWIYSQADEEAADKRRAEAARRAEQTAEHAPRERGR